MIFGKNNYNEDILKSFVDKCNSYNGIYDIIEDGIIISMYDWNIFMSKTVLVKYNEYKLKLRLWKIKKLMT